MARQFLTGLNLNKNELLNARIQNLAVEPQVGTSVAGQIYFNTTDNTLRYFNGTAWLTLAQGGDVSSAITNAINALTTAAIEEDPSATTSSGTMYFTDQRAKDAAATLLTGASLTNITITGTGAGLTISAENGVADSTTDDLDEGTTNKYFTEQRARGSVSAGDGLDYNSTTGVFTADLGSGLEILDGEIVVDTDTIATRTFATGEVTTHNNLSTGVHGITGAVVGTTDSQTLTNKELGSGTSLGANLDADSNSITNLDDPTNAQDAATKNYVDTEIGDHSDLTTGVHGVGAGSVVGTDLTQTLTNKTLGSGSALSDDLDADGHTITGLATPVADSDAATKGYVDSVAEGLHVHASVAAATIANVDLTPGNAPTTIDGVTLTDQMRILVKSQTAPAENGIYYYDQATDDLVRALDYNIAAEIDAGDFVFVDGGNTYGNTGWVQTNAVTTLGTDPIAWVQFSGAGTFTAGNGLTLDGTEFNVGGTADRITVTANAVDIAATYIGQNTITTLGTITTGTWNGSTIAVANGGTGATDAAGAKTNLGFMTRYVAQNPILTPSSGIVTWTVTHNLGTKHVLVQVYETATDDSVEVDVERTNTNQVTLQWVAGSNVALGSYEVIIIG